jgi:pimeloyl-ACP methyl ester carboxylesterase
MANGFQVVDVGLAQGSPTRTLVAGVSEPKATVLLFIGGDGMLKLTESGQTGHGHTFVRSFGMWKAHGIEAVLVDSPEDLGNAMRGHQRGSQQHLNRVAEVVRHFQSKRPLWIFGHSMGTSTVAAFLGSNRPEINLLQGYIVAGTHRGESVPAQIELPALAIHHRLEGCPSTPIEASEAIIRSRSADTPKAMVLLDGGTEPGHRCQSRSYHGFHGIEETLINTAAEFILKH